MKNFLNIFKDKDNNKNFSFGRVLFFVLLVLASFKWAENQEIPSTMMTVIMTFMGYIFGTKVTEIIKKYIGEK